MPETIYFRVLQIDTGSFKVKPSDKIKIRLALKPGHHQHHSSYKFPAEKAESVNHIWKITNNSMRAYHLIISIRKMSIWEFDPLIGKFELDLQKLPLNQVSQMTFDLDKEDPERIDSGQMRVEVHRCNNFAFPFDAPTVTLWDF